MRKIVLLAVSGVLAFASVALAAASGTYAGTSTLKLDGVTATHPFSLGVKHSKVTSVSLLAGSNCAALNATTGKRVSFTITNNAFKGKLNFAGGSFVKLTGHFHGHKVTGSFKGKAKGLGGTSCSVPKNTFSATS